MQISSNSIERSFLRFSRSLSGLKESTQRITSGQKVGRAQDNPGALAFAEQLKMDYKLASSAQSNHQNMISALQSSDESYLEIQGYLNRIYDLTNVAAELSTDDADRQIYQEEVDNLIGKIDNVAQKTTFNGINLLKGQNGLESDNLSLKLQIGPVSSQSMNVEFAPATSAALGIDSLDISTYSTASSALTDIANALNDLGEALGLNSGQLTRLTDNNTGLSASNEGLTAGLSWLQNTNLAQELQHFTNSLVEVKNEIAGLSKERTVTNDIMNTIVMRQFNISRAVTPATMGEGLKGNKL